MLKAFKNLSLLIILFCSSFSLRASDYFDYHLYLRSGIGSNTKGGDQTCFQNPGTAGNEFRLGNECSNYGEMVFIGTPLKEKNGPRFSAQVRLAYSQPGHTNWEGANGENPIAVRESFASAEGIGGSPLRFWAGKRFYRQHDVYINDFYYFADMSGNGAGIENFSLLGGQFHLAWLRETTEVQTDRGQRAMNVVDFRLNGLAISERDHLNFWSAYAFLPSATSSEEDEADKDLASLKGYVFGVLYERSLRNGFNHFALVYGEGLLREFNLFAPKDLEVGVEADNLSDSRRLRVVEHLGLDLHPDLSLHFASTFEWRDQGDANQREVWWNIGLRPVYYFTDHYHLAFEAGSSLVNRKGEDLRRLTRLTISPQVAPSRGLWGRPLVRAFYTHSFWSRSNRGQVGGETYQGATSGANFGVQIEAWF